jgi:hypothetical protein
LRELLQEEPLRQEEGGEREGEVSLRDNRRAGFQSDI